MAIEFPGSFYYKYEFESQAKALLVLDCEKLPFAPVDSAAPIYRLQFQFGELFLLTPSLQSTLLGLRGLCLEVENLELIYFQPNKKYSLKEFESEQKNSRDKVTEQLADFSSRSLAMCVKACDAVIDGFLEANKVCAGHKMMFMERAVLRKECRNFTNFQRLADFLTNDTTI